MKVVFAGPSLYRASFEPGEIVLRPPAAQGDVLRAVLDGAGIIGLIDGVFSNSAAVWHKEILFALTEGVEVLGAASMGALRAAECASFGMEPIGMIAARYLSGDLDDDAAVAIVHGPAEMGFMPLTEALVDFEATVAAMREADCLSSDEAELLAASARLTFFEDRTAARVIKTAFPNDALRQGRIVNLYRRHRVSLKQLDALLLVKEIGQRSISDRVRRRTWCLSEPPTWRALLAEMRADIRPH